jgi:hypothetical protein
MKIFPYRFKKRQLRFNVEQDPERWRVEEGVRA